MQSPNPWEDARGFECMGSVGWYGLVGLLRCGGDEKRRTEWQGFDPTRLDCDEANGVEI